MIVELRALGGYEEDLAAYNAWWTSRGLKPGDYGAAVEYGRKLTAEWMTRNRALPPNKRAPRPVTNPPAKPVPPEPEEVLERRGPIQFQTQQPDADPASVYSPAAAPVQAESSSGIVPAVALGAVALALLLGA